MRSTHARNVIEVGRADGLGAFRPMRADGKTVRLVAQALDEIEDRIVAPQREGGRAGGSAVPWEPCGDSRQALEEALLAHDQEGVTDDQGLDELAEFFGLAEPGGLDSP